MPERIARVAAEHGWTAPGTFEHDFDARQREAFETELRAVPFAESVVRAIRGPRAVVSNGTRAEMTLKLTHAGFLDAFVPNLFSAVEVARSKPFPDVYLKAASTLGARPQASIAIEDSLPGAAAALAAGFTVFGFAARTNADALAQLGARVFHAMTELPDLLRASGVELT
jgi:HAD superfamily hydrolase (TIGR01509 family)